MVFNIFKGLKKKNESRTDCMCQSQKYLPSGPFLEKRATPCFNRLSRCASFLSHAASLQGEAHRAVGELMLQTFPCIQRAGNGATVTQRWG